MGEKKATKLNAEAFPCCVFHYFPGSSISYDKNNRPLKQEREKKFFWRAKIVSGAIFDIFPTITVAARLRGT